MLIGVLVDCYVAPDLVALGASLGSPLFARLLAGVVSILLRVLCVIVLIGQRVREHELRASSNTNTCTPSSTVGSGNDSVDDLIALVYERAQCACTSPYLPYAWFATINTTVSIVLLRLAESYNVSAFSATLIAVALNVVITSVQSTRTINALLYTAKLVRTTSYIEMLQSDTPSACILLCYAASIPFSSIAYTPIGSTCVITATVLSSLLAKAVVDNYAEIFVDYIVRARALDALLATGATQFSVDAARAGVVASKTALDRYTVTFYATQTPLAARAAIAFALSTLTLYHSAFSVVSVVRAGMAGSFISAATVWLIGIYVQSYVDTTITQFFGAISVSDALRSSIPRQMAERAESAFMNATSFFTSLWRAASAAAQMDVFRVPLTFVVLIVAPAIELTCDALAVPSIAAVALSFCVRAFVSNRLILVRENSLLYHTAMVAEVDRALTCVRAASADAVALDVAEAFYAESVADLAIATSFMHDLFNWRCKNELELIAVHFTMGKILLRALHATFITWRFNYVAYEAPMLLLLDAPTACSPDGALSVLAAPPAGIDTLCTSSLNTLRLFRAVIPTTASTTPLAASLSSCKNACLFNGLSSSLDTAVRAGFLPSARAAVAKAAIAPSLLLTLRRNSFSGLDARALAGIATALFGVINVYVFVNTRAVFFIAPTASPSVVLSFFEATVTAAAHFVTGGAIAGTIPDAVLYQPRRDGQLHGSMQSADDEKLCVA